jgi:hypothetical protein
VLTPSVVRRANVQTHKILTESGHFFVMKDL